MADRDFQMRVGTDAEGSGCWEVTIDGALYQDRSQAPLRALIEQRRAQQPHTPLARWAQLEPIEELGEHGDAGQPGWAGIVQDGPGWREG
jgi:hypothetical protein